MSLLGEIY